MRFDALFRWPKKSLLAFAFVFSALFFPLSVLAHQICDGHITITEVMSNPEDEDREEFIELYNDSQSPVDLTGWKFTDGDALDEIVAWQTGSTDTFPQQDVTMNTLVVPSHAFAVILDSEYTKGKKPYTFPKGTVILTVKNTTLGDGLTATDPVTLFTASGTKETDVIDTYGTPKNSDIWQDRDDDGKDDLPMSAADGYSVEKRDVTLADQSGSWQVSFVKYGTPGSPASEKPKNSPPVAAAGEDKQSPLGASLTFDASKSTDSNGDILTYRWDLGEGTAKTGVKITHTYQKVGTYTVTLFASDGQVESKDILVVIISDGNIPSSSPSGNQVQTENPASASPSQGSIHLSELLPNPAGDEEQEEFIEIYNSGSTEADLTGWKLSDAGGKTYTFAAKETFSSKITPNSFLVVPRTVSVIALNNTGEESVRLAMPTGETVDSIQYKDAPEGQSYARSTEGTWGWTTTITKGNTNAFSQPPAENKPADSPHNAEPQPSQQSPQEEPQKKSATTFSSSSKIFLSEILPNPQGQDQGEEWIEISNLDTRDIDLFGWKLTDTKDTYTFPEHSLIRKKSFLLIDQETSAINLRNTGEKIFLIDPYGSIKNGVEYTNAKSGLAFARKDAGGWAWTTMHSPGKVNTFSQEEAASEKSAESEEKDDETSSDPQESFQKITIPQAYTLPLRKKVEVHGWVSLEPGTVDEKFLYLSGREKEGGIKIYFGKAEWPDISTGDEISVKGKISQASGERKINITATTDIQSTGKSGDIVVTASEGILLEDFPKGSVVSFTGNIARSSRSTVFLKTDDEDVSVSLKAGQWPDETWEKETALTVTGILVDGESIKILPRYQEDIQKQEATPSSDQPITAPVEAVPLSSPATPSPLPYTAIVIGLIAVGGGLIWGEKKFQIVSKLKYRFLSEHVGKE